METKEKEHMEGSPESAFRLWGEEKEDDVVYSVYLKKVSYKASEESLHDWETFRIRTIKAATVQRLVEHLPVAVEEMDSVYINVFFSTYQTFTTLQHALSMLFDRYVEIQETAAEVEKDRLQKNIRSVVMMWLDEGHDDFREGPDYPCLQLIGDFARDVMKDVELQLRTQIMISSFEQEESPRKHLLQPPKFQFSVCDEVDFMMLGTVGFQDIREIDSQLLAEQLTLMEAELFRKVIPQHCLGSIWSRRDKKRGVDPVTVAATVNQFNDITLKVMSTILGDKTLRSATRAMIITKWIDVAQACRELKNFSSLKAIISALQSHPVHRLRRSWATVPKANMVLFEDLANIFLDANNFETWREIINKEGTAKFATVSPRSSKKVIRSLRKKTSTDKLIVQKRESWQGKVNGTVPYLGTFLTDLVKIDSAYPDTVEKELVNFDKKRKEFEVIAQIRLLQMASKNYQIIHHEKFWEWFDGIQVLSYQECCGISDEIQPPSASPSSAPPTPSLVKSDRPKTFRKFFSFTAEDYRHRNGGSNNSNNRVPTRCRTGPEAKNHSSTSSISSTSSTPSSDDSMSIASIDTQSPSSTASSTGSTSLSMSMTSSSTEASSRDSSHLSVENSPVKSKHMKPSLSFTCLTSLQQQHEPKSSMYEFPSQSCRIIRVGLEESMQEEGDGNIYRSLLITHQEHTPAVIKTTLSKHHMPPSCNHNDYILVQLVADKELLIPDDANVFYAMNTNSEPHFLLKKKAYACDKSTPLPKSSRDSQKNSKRLHIKRMSWVRIREDER